MASCQAPPSHGGLAIRDHDRDMHEPGDYRRYTDGVTVTGGTGSEIRRIMIRLGAYESGTSSESSDPLGSRHLESCSTRWYKIVCTGMTRSQYVLLVR